MKQLLPLTVLTGLLAMPVHAQRNVEVGLSSGVTHYYGDLGNWDGGMQWNSMRPGMAITFRDYFNNPKRYVTRALTTETRLSWHRIGYNEVEPTAGLSGTDLRNFRRGLNFRNDLYGISQHLVLNMYREPYTPLFKQRFFAYAYIGVGLYYGRPKGDLFRGSPDLSNRYHYWDDGTIRDTPRGSGGGNVVEQDGTYETDLYSYVTQGEGEGEGAMAMARPSPWHVGFPMGFGIRYMLSKNLSVGAEFSYYTFLTDMLDNVSGRYATYAEIGQAYPNDSTAQYMARYISDPTGWGTNGEAGPATSKRGNPGLPDTFSYFMFEVSYKFKRSPSRRSFVSL
ncbi:MAG TPA: hypothetical protein VGE21_11915 [Flavobacteriales bacterium]